jgi:hypothetical protein
MKKMLILVAVLLTSQLKAQISPQAGSPSGALPPIISFLTYNPPPDYSTPGPAIKGYIAIPFKDGSGNWAFSVSSCSDVTQCPSYPMHFLPIYEWPGLNSNKMRLDMGNRKFNFYPYTYTELDMDQKGPHHSNTVLHFVGNDGKQYTLKFDELFNYP